MINGMYISTMGAMVQASRTDNIANNLANVNTNGFKPNYTRFRALPTESEWSPTVRRINVDDILRHTGGGTWLEATATHFKAGPMQVTGNPFDLALEDAGDEKSFFMIQPAGDDEGTVRYTRAGHFIPDQDGVLRTPDGGTLLGPDGAPVVLDIPEGAMPHVRANGDIEIAVDGEVEVVAQIGVVRTADTHLLTKIGDNLFSSDGAEFAPAADGVVAGTLEKSATHAIEEMTAMIEAHRAYDLNMRFVSMQDETLGQTVRRITAAQ